MPTSMNNVNVLSTRTSIIPLSPDELPLVVSDIATAQYFQVAIVTVLVYDAVITMNKEAKYFWKVPRNAVNFVYFMNRYVGIFGAVAFLFLKSFQADLPLCNFAYWSRNISNLVTGVLIDYILMIRVLALYSRERALSIILWSLLISVSAFKAAVSIYLSVLSEISVFGFGAETKFCGASRALPWKLGTVDWLIPMAYGMILMILAVYKATEYWRMSAGLKGFALVRVLVQDQVLYFMLVIICTMFAILEFKLKVTNEALSTILTLLGNQSFLCVLGSRMLFNLREAGERGLNEGTNYRVPSSTVSEIDFAEPVHRRRSSEIEGMESAA